jgi:CheY-like chemotaxis protein
LVEDDEAIRRLFEQVLAMDGYTVLAPETGAEALELLAQHGAPIDLLITDVFMPGMSGRELVSRVGALRPEMKVIFISGYPDETLARQGVPGTRFLLKPFSTAELVSAVRASLAG